MHHMSAYQATFTTAAPTETEINAVADGLFVVQNNHLIPQKPTSVLFAAGFGATITRLRMQSPKLLIPTTPNVMPLNPSITMANPPRIADWSNAPLGLNAMEELQVFATHTSIAAEQNAFILGLDQGQQPAPVGDIRTIRGTAAGVLTANVWSNVGTITWQNNLPAGLYAIVGGLFQSATVMAGRLIIENQFFRPGAPGTTAITDFTYPLFRFGGLGLWGTFHNTFMPAAEFFASAADAAEVILLDVVKIG